MLSWIVSNIGNLIVGGIIAVILISVVIHMIKTKRSGGSSCGCSCDSCAMCHSCHHEK